MGYIWAHTYVIEFQKCRLPHAHILLILYPTDRLGIPDDVDRVISAEIPHPTEDPELHRLVIHYMIHQSCGTHGISTVCMVKEGPDGSKLGKESYLKPFQIDTLFLASQGFPQYRRHEGYILLRAIL